MEDNGLRRDGSIAVSLQQLFCIYARDIPFSYSKKRIIFGGYFMSETNWLFIDNATNRVTYLSTFGELRDMQRKFPTVQDTSNDVSDKKKYKNFNDLINTDQFVLMYYIYNTMKLPRRTE